MRLPAPAAPLQVRTRDLASWAIWPLAIATGLVVAFDAVAADLQPSAWWVALWALPLLAVPLEHVFFEDPAWKPTFTEWTTDAMYLVVQHLTGFLTMSLLFVVLTPLSVALTTNLGTRPWPTAWPLAAQFALALAIAEFFYYVYHRLAHAVSLLGRFHAVHHSSEKLNWWAAARQHPIDTALDLASNVAPLVLLGAGLEILFLWYTLVSFHVRLQHSNLPIRSGAFVPLVSTAEIHRLHHARAPVVSNANYGKILLIWDWIFGTLQRGPRPRALGVPSRTPYPRTFWAQLAVPFTRRGRID